VGCRVLVGAGEKGHFCFAEKRKYLWLCSVIGQGRINIAAFNAILNNFEKYGSGGITERPS
jgi:hypothetical protein